MAAGGPWRTLRLTDDVGATMETEAEIRKTIQRYRETFGAKDKEGWLALFTDDATLEDPVGSPACRGRVEISAFWDRTHDMITAISTKVIQGPAVCGGEAAFAFEARIDLGNGTVIIPIIDLMRFAPDGRITSMRAFVDSASIRPA